RYEDAVCYSSFFFSSRRRHTRFSRDWSSDVCSSDLNLAAGADDELILKDNSAEAGKVLFRDGVPGGTATCNGCHSNAGANVIGRSEERRVGKECRSRG